MPFSKIWKVFAKPSRKWKFDIPLKSPRVQESCRPSEILSLTLKAACLCLISYFIMQWFCEWIKYVPLQIITWQNVPFPLPLTALQQILMRFISFRRTFKFLKVNLSSRRRLLWQTYRSDANCRDLIQFDSKLCASEVNVLIMRKFPFPPKSFECGMRLQSKVSLWSRNERF